MKTFIANPFFGVECVVEDAEKNIEEVTIPRQEDQLEIVETGYEETVNAARSRYEVGKKGNTGTEEEVEVVFNSDLGLACEKLPKGVTIDNLWRIA